ncbi:TetR/AcrR family transcriptional regulator [Saccharopolyspora indica]|uniref:TetR/AcrR family transcriptional regulator n=1 Tax=Saccharopolyspora indica TaxID=1229659 RepID=UPI0022EA6E17|nr:TetR/AcrR family transcriptional regulator [Saccharopolyspora indica]MDA3646560.1 TetR/AcrR family transcriptional regulator [Saccharopolyspora indica]
MRTVDPDRYAERRRRILAGAADAFAASGYAKTTVGDLRKATGVSSGALFHYFADKAAIFRAIVADDCARVRAELGRIDSADPRRAFFTAVQVMAGDLVQPNAAGMAAAVLERASADPELAAILAELEQVERDALTGLAELMRRDGLMDPAVSPSQAARWTITVLDGLYLHCDDEDFDAQDEIRFLVESLARTFRITPSASA